MHRHSPAAMLLHPTMANHGQTKSVALALLPANPNHRKTQSTPKKAIIRATKGKEYDGQMTSITSELQTLSQALWNSTQNTPQSKTVLGNKNSQTERAGYHKRNKSEPDKSDFTTLGSGTESTKKSSTNNNEMEVEAPEEES